MLFCCVSFVLLTLLVTHKQALFVALRGFQVKKGCGIIYCRARETCTQVASELTLRGLPSKPYHAALSASVRAETQSEWMDGHIAIIVATISFGMGVDKPNVRSV